MNRLPPAARRALAMDISRSNDAITRWSLRSLANINHGENNDDTDRTNTNPTTLNLKAFVRKEAAAALLNDVKLRLAKQHDRCHRLLQEAQSTSLGIDEDNGDAEQSNNQNENQNGKKRPRIIRAVHANWNTNASHASKQREIASQLSSDAISSLSNLEAMHADTYRLVYDLLPLSSSVNDDDDTDSSIPDILNVPILNRFSSADQILIKSVFEQIRSRHAQTVESMADVVIALRRRRRLLGKYNPSAKKACGLDRPLIDSFLRNRLVVQLLCDHYVALCRDKYHGGIAVDCDVMDVLEDAVLEASHVCDANLGVAPEVYMSAHVVSPSLLEEAGTLPSIPSPADFEAGGKYEGKVPDGQIVSLTLVRPWVHHALVEVLKNAASTSVKKMQKLQNSQIKKSNGGSNNDTSMLHLPPVHVRVIDEPTQVRICVIDRGVGLSDDEAKHKAFMFAESASAKRWDRLEEQQSYAMVRQPLGSLGVGLPLSRMMMQMFGGDVSLANNASSEGEGEGDSVIVEMMNSGGCTTVVTLIRDDTLKERVDEMMPVHDDCYTDVHSIERAV
uniref:Protein-serine/threonine kinase n=2 Tax=Ditylum brightwellii TaxID=49249 RepID=A0A7S4QWJ0_9STRA